MMKGRSRIPVDCARDVASRDLNCMASSLSVLMN